MSAQTHVIRKRLLAIGLAVAGLLCVAGVSIARPERVGRMLLPLWVRTISDVAYGPHPENRLNLMLPRWSIRRQRPAVLVFHGGGWQTGDRNETQYRICRRYVKMGFLVANAEYRLGAIPPAVEDAVTALRWFRSVAESYGGDPHRIVVTGASAGAHLALLAAFQSGVETAAVVNFYGPSNLAPLLSRPAIREVLPGGNPEFLAVRMSPQTYVRRGLPPVFSVHGTADEIVPPEQTAALTHAIQAAGGEASDLFIEGGRHGLTVPQEDVAFDAVFAFLRRQGILQR
jgi:acetyl esterase/lipase